MDVDEVVALEGLGDAAGVAERAEDRVPQRRDVERLEAPLAGALRKAARSAGLGLPAGEGDLDAERAELETQVEGRLGGSRPLPVPEEVQHAHRAVDYNS